MLLNISKYKEPLLIEHFKYKYYQDPMLLDISKYKYYLPGTYFTGHLCYGIAIREITESRNQVLEPNSLGL